MQGIDAAIENIESLKMDTPTKSYLFVGGDDTIGPVRDLHSVRRSVLHRQACSPAFRLWCCLRFAMPSKSVQLSLGSMLPSATPRPEIRLFGYDFHPVWPEIQYQTFGPEIQLFGP